MGEQLNKFNYSAQDHTSLLFKPLCTSATWEYVVFMMHRPRKVKMDSLNTCYPHGAYILLEKTEKRERREGRRNEGRKREGRKEKREGGDGLIVMRALRKMKQDCLSTG